MRHDVNGLGACPLQCGEYSRAHNARADTNIHATPGPWPWRQADDALHELVRDTNFV